MVKPQRPQFVLFGSSIVQVSYGHGGWGSHLANIYARKADVVLRGYAGWNSRRGVQVLDKVFPKDEAVQPTLVIAYFGGNDSQPPHPSGFGPHVPLSEYVENMKKIATHLKSLSDKTRVLFLSTPPISEEQLSKSWGGQLVANGLNNVSRKRYSDACIDVCKEMNLKVIDMYDVIQQREDWKKTCFLDGMHFSAEGSKLVVPAILKTLKEAEWEPNLHWKSMSPEFNEDSPYDSVGPDGKPWNISDSTDFWDEKWE